MDINIKALRSTFFFLGSIAAIKGQGAVTVNLDSQTDAVLKGLVTSIKAGVIGSDTDALSVADQIKDPNTKADAYAILGIASPEDTGTFDDVVTTELVIESVEPEPTPEPEPVPAVLTEDEEYQEYIDNLKDLLDGNVKIVIEKLSNTGLNDEDKIRLIDLEQQDKNRKAVLTAINEL